MNFVGTIPTNKVNLWVIQEPDGRWIVELETEDSALTLHSFTCADIGYPELNAVAYGNLVGQLLGIPCKKLEQACTN